MPNHTATTIAKMTDHEDFGGFGYLGHENRTGISDAQLAEAANDLRIPAVELFMWANSRCARHFMDNYEDRSGAYRRFCDALTRDLVVLRAEEARA